MFKFSLKLVCPAPGAQYNPVLQEPQPLQNVPSIVSGYSWFWPTEADIDVSPHPETVKPVRLTPTEAVASKEWPPCCSDAVHTELSGKIGEACTGGRMVPATKLKSIVASRVA